MRRTQSTSSCAIASLLPNGSQAYDIDLYVLSLQQCRFACRMGPGDMVLDLGGQIC